MVSFVFDGVGVWGLGVGVGVGRLILGQVLMLIGNTQGW